METSVNWQARHISVVLVAESPIEPKSIDPDLLGEKEITQPEWTVTSKILTPVFAHTVYANGIRIRT